MRSLRAVLALTLAVCALAGCHAGASAPGGGTQSGGTAAPGGTSTHTIIVGGRQRTYLLYRPADLGGPAPLVVFLHGGFGSGAQAERSYGWDAQADSAHFLVAYPNGVDRAWNTGGGCCGTPGRSAVDDVAFIAAVVADIEAGQPVDRARVYATGISNGGIMDYTLACRTTLFAAIGPDSATLLGDCPHPTPISVIHVHGTADRNIPYRGGTGDGVAHITGPAVPQIDRMWQAADRCRAPAVTTAATVTTSLADCPDGRQVELVTLAGAGHQWPGGVGKPAIERLLGTDPPSTALNATRTIWSFFARHTRTG